MTHDLPTSFALAGYPVYLADSQSARFSLDLKPMAKPITRLRKRAKQGDLGLPRATLAFYGPDNTRASKAVLGIFLHDDGEAIIHRYFSEAADARYTIDIQESILARLREHNVRSLIMMEEIFGARMRRVSTIRKVRRVHSVLFGKREIALREVGSNHSGAAFDRLVKSVG